MTTDWVTLVDNQVPYVVAHRHAAGNFAQGVLLVRVSAAAKLGKVGPLEPRKRDRIAQNCFRKIC